MVLPEVAKHPRVDIPFPKQLKGCVLQTTPKPEPQAVATELSQIHWLVGGSERGICRVLPRTELTSLGSLLILIKITEGAFDLFAVHATWDIETISPCLASLKQSFGVS